MHQAFAVVGLLVVAAATAGASTRLGVSAPLVLTALGIVASFVPGLPEYRLEPDVVLLGILPPLLYSTALRTPWVTLRTNRRAIGLLSVALVLVTAFAVAGLATLLLPGLPLAAAVALGAVVAPPDAVAASAIARRVGMPRRTVTILEGESLLNDATALVTLRTALLALAVQVSALQVGVSFVRAVAVGVAVGWAVSTVVTPVRRRVADPVVDTSVSLLVPYVAYLVSEQLEGSGVLAVVIAGVMLGHRAPDIQSAAARVTERTLWRSVEFLLEAVVFLLIGLQLRVLIGDVGQSSVHAGRVVLVCAGVLAGVIAVRLLWMFPATYAPFLFRRVAKAEQRPSWQVVTLVGWAGIRGVVTLAAAFALPRSTPEREVLVLAAFTVVAGTLLLQGSTLPWLVRLLGVRGPDPAQDALQQAMVTQRAVTAGIARLDAETRPSDPPEIVDALRSWSLRLAHSSWERLGGTHGLTPGVAFRRLRVAMLQAERAVVVEVRRSGEVADDVLEEVLERLDQEEAMLAGLAEEAPRTSDDVLVSSAPPGCAHLASAPGGTVPRTPYGCEDCLAINERLWVHLRMCLDCGRVGCCDSSPRRHATAHYHDTSHPVMRSIELGEAWRWCYVDQLTG